MSTADDSAPPTNDPLPAAPPLFDPSRLPAATTGHPVHCPHFGPCGGCTFLDQPYAEEARAKEEKLRTALGRHAALAAVPVLPILAAREPLLYRTAIKVPFGWSRTGPVAGFFERRSHHIVDLTTCLIQHPTLTRLLLETKQLVGELRIAIHDPRTGRGILRHLVARLGDGTGEVLAGLVVQAKGYGKIRGLALGLMERMASAGLVGVVQNVHADEEGPVMGERTFPLAGRTWLEEVSDGLRFRTSLDAFAQVNAKQATVLYGEVLRMLGELSGKRVVDLFAGVGPIALRVARAGAQVVAVEYRHDAVQDGRWAARTNGLDERVQFFAGDAAQGLAKVAAEGPIDAIVVDPPRRGLPPKLIETIAATSARTLVYVSCDAFTLARDLEELAKSFAVTAVRPVDLFPRTPHLEAVAHLERP